MYETCQRVKPSPSSHTPLRLLSVASDVWRSISTDFVFGRHADALGRTSVLGFVDHFSKMVHLTPVSVDIRADEYSALFLDIVFRLYGLPETIVSDRDPHFVATF